MRTTSNENMMRDWNFNQGWLEEILQLWREAHQYRQRAAAQASLESWWDSMRSIWAMMQWDIEKAIEKDETIKKRKEDVEEAFKTANSMFMSNVPGSDKSAVKNLDKIEFGIKFLIGALQYYKFKMEQKDPRYAT